jgi:hypothetical protein
MEQFYKEALTGYRDYKYPDWHEYIARKMTDWYKASPFATTHWQAVVEVDIEAAEVEEGAVAEVPAVVACGASGAFRTSHLRCSNRKAKAAKMAKMARGLVFATETFWLMVKQL